MITGTYRQGLATHIDCDALIIGSGAGGASVADVLTKAGLDVVMLEEGAFIPQSEKTLTEEFATLWRGNGLMTTFGNGSVAYAEGRCVGGGTEINSAIFQRAPDSLLEDWANKYQIQAFNAASLAPYYQRAANIVSANHPSINDPYSAVLQQGAQALNWKCTPLDRSVIFSPDPVTGKLTQRKQSMSATLIQAALNRGMRLISNCKATKLITKNHTIHQVEAQATNHQNQLLNISVRAKKVFLCAGAIHTPKLLLNSGIKHNIGQTLRLHPTIKCLAIFDRPINAHLSRLPNYAVTEFMPTERIGGSVFTLGTFGMSIAEDWFTRQGLLPEWQYSGLYYNMVRAEGKGKIYPIPLANEPFIRYQLCPQDWQHLTSGLQHLGELLFAAGAKAVYPSIWQHPGWFQASSCKEFQTSGLPQKRTNLFTIHLMGSCPLGENKTLTASNSFGQVHDIKNLIIADGSQIPEALGVNPQATIMAIAFRNAEAALD